MKCFLQKIDRKKGLPGLPILLLLFSLLFHVTVAQEKKEPADPQKAAAAAASEKPATASAPAKAASTEKKPVKELGVVWPKWFQPTVGIRGRLEQPWGKGFAASNEDLYLLGRFAVGATITPSKYVNFFVMGQDGRIWFHNDVKTRARGTKDTFDLRQLYADIHGKQGDLSIAFRVGRQYLDFGGRRLVATAAWGNSVPPYDAAKLTLSSSSYKIDLFASSRVSNNYTYKFNEVKDGENLYGFYTEFSKLIPQATLQPYVFWRTQTLVTGERSDKGDSDLWTYGVRLTGKLPHRVDYTIEEVLQRGTYSRDDISAYGMIYQIGYVLSPVKWKPRISMDLNYASGDKSRTDGKRGTFDQLYPSNHNVFGMTDQVGWRNLLHLKWSFDCVPHPKIKLLFSLSDFYLATVQDGMYASSGSLFVRNTKATSRHIGWEPDIQFDYAFTKKFSAGFGVSRLFPGEFLKQSTQGHAYTYPYLIWEYKF